MKHPTARAALAEKPSEVAQETLDKDETEFVLAVMRLATGAHPFAAIRMLTLAIIELRRGPIEREPKLSTGDALAGDNMARILAHCGTQRDFAELIRPDDTRKPWVEPTVTECATTNRRPATLTIAGVDLPNPAPPAPTIAPTAAEILNAVGWLRNRAGLQPVRTAEFESIARIMEGLGAEIVRQAAEISELQGLLEDAIDPARFVNELASMSDAEAASLNGDQVRDIARSKLDAGFVTLPRLYGEEARQRARDALFDRFHNPSKSAVQTVAANTGELVDIVAEALGLQRAC